MIGWKFCYELRGRELFVSNDAAPPSAALEGDGDATRAQRDTAHAPDDLTLIRLDSRVQAFDRVFAKLDARRVATCARARGENLNQDGDQNGAPSKSAAVSEEFFSGNVASLLDVASPVSRAEIRRRATPGRLYVEVELILGKVS